MFDLRYHVASLAAVFFALVIGILVGVALASHGLGNTERDRLQEDLRRAESSADSLQAQVDALNDAGAADRAFVENTYKVVMANRLKGARIAILFVGSIDDDVRSAITSAIGDAGGRPPLRVRAVKVPIDLTAVTRRLSNRPFLTGYAGEDKLGRLGEALGQEFVAGTDTPLWNALQNLLVEERFGPPKPPADGVVVVRTAAPQTGETGRFLQGLYSGLGQIGVPAVGVERTGDGESAMKAFQKKGLSTVNDIDRPGGKLALAILLSDAGITGDFGTKPPADEWLPGVPAVPTTTGG